MKTLYLTDQQAAWLSSAARKNGDYPAIIKALEVQREGLLVRLSQKQITEFREYLVENPDGEILEGILADLEDLQD